MKIEKKQEVLVFYPGDSVTCGVTHEIKVGGEKSWVNYSVTHQVQSVSPVEEVAQKLQEHVDAQVIKNIHQTVTTVRKNQ